MPTVTSELTGETVDTNSEAWRHECECSWLLENKPTKTDKHLYLFGVRDRDQLFVWDSRIGKSVLAEDWERNIITNSRPLIKIRGLESADRILADAKKLYLLRQERQAGEA